MRVGYNLVKLGFINEVELTRMLARQFRMPAVDLTNFEVDARIAKLIPAELAQRHLVLPLKREGRTLTVAMADPSDLGVIDDLKFITRYDIFPVIAGEYTLRNAVDKHYGENTDDALQNILNDIDDDGDVEVVDPARAKHLDSLLQSLLARPPDRRDAFLHEICAGDESLERDLSTLLNLEPEARAPPERQSIEATALNVARSEKSAGRRLRLVARPRRIPLPHPRADRRGRDGRRLQGGGRTAPSARRGEVPVRRIG